MIMAHMPITTIIRMSMVTVSTTTTRKNMLTATRLHTKRTFRSVLPINPSPRLKS